MWNNKSKSSRLNLSDAFDLDPEGWVGWGGRDINKHGSGMTPEILEGNVHTFM